MYMKDPRFLADMDSRLRGNDAAECRRYRLTQRVAPQGSKARRSGATIPK